MFVSAERIPFLEYGSMTVDGEVGFLMRSPPLSYVSNIYRLAFSDAVWICSMALCLLATLVIALTFKIRATANEKVEHLKLSDFFLLATAYLCQMGAEKSANKLSSKIAMVMQIRVFLRLLHFWTHSKKNIFNFFCIAANVINCAVIRLLIVYSDYCGFIAINNKVSSKRVRFDESSIWYWYP